MVELAEASKGSYRIERYAIETLPRDAVVDGNITNLEAVAEAVKRAWKRMGTSTRFVAMALPLPICAQALTGWSLMWRRTSRRVVWTYPSRPFWTVCAWTLAWPMARSTTTCRCW